MESLQHCFRQYDILHSRIVLDSSGFPYWQADHTFDLPFDFIQADGLSAAQLHDRICQLADKPLMLKKEFPCRFYLFRISSREHLLMVIFHHCMMDGKGMQRFTEYLSQVYNCLKNRQDIRHLQAPVFHAYQEQNDSYLMSPMRKQGAAEIYNYLKDTPFVTHMPFTDKTTGDRPAPYQLVLGKGLMHECNAFCEKHHHTMFRVLAACWGTVLCRMLNIERVVIDHSINLRSAAEKDYTGVMINNMPLLIDVSSCATSLQLLESIRNGRRLLRNYAFVDYIDLLTELRKLAPNLYGSTPNIIINYPRPLDLIRLDLEGCTSETFHTPIVGTSESLGLHIFDDEEGTCLFTYQPIIPLDFIKELAQSFKSVLSQMIEENSHLCDYELVSTERRQAIIANNVVRPFEMRHDLLRQIRHYAETEPDKQAVVCQSERLSYAVFEQLTDHIARQVLQRRGVATGPFHVAVCMDRSLYTIPVIVGILKAGATYIPIDSGTPLARVEYILNDSQAAFLIADAVTTVPSSTCPQVLVEDLLASAQQDSHPLPGMLPATPYIIYTSGTTGKPKSTPISSLALHQLIDNILHHNKWIHAASRVLQMASISFDASVVDIFPTLYSGATIVMATEQERKDIDLLHALLRREHVSFATIPPAVMGVLPNEGLEDLQTLVFAGESTPQKVFDRWLNRGIRIVNAYGPTENTVCSTFADVLEGSSPHNIGKPLQNVSCYVLDDHLHLLPFGVPGELCLGGNQLTAGYLNQKELNDQKFMKNPFATSEQVKAGVNQVLYRTGDLVSLRPDYSIEFIGRTDYQVKLNGYRIELEEIGQCLQTHPSVSQAFCVVETSDSGHQQLLAYVAPNSLSSTVGSRQLQKWLSDRLPPYMVPTRWIFVDGFQLTQNGKIDRSLLPQVDSAFDLSEQSDYVAPETASEHLLCGIFAKILEVEKVSVEANLFEIYGLESIQVMTAVYEANRQGIELSVSTFYKNKSIRNSLKDNNIYPYYWLNEDDGDKPVIILVCGLVYLHPSHDALLDLLIDRYSILVLDSIHEFFFMRERCTFRHLLDHYMEVLPKMLKGKNVFGVTGWCIGGEISLQLAIELQQAGIASPVVFSLDGYLHHNMGKNTPLFVMNFPNQPPEVNRERDRIKNEFIESAFFRPYSGTVYCFFADQFSKYPPNGEILTDEEVAFNYKSFMENSYNWENSQPGCIVTYLHDNHYTFLQRKNMVQVVKVIDEVRKQLNM